MPTLSNVVHVLHIALLLLSFHSLIVRSADCTGATYCEACSGIQGCGWCGATQTCTEGNMTGPAVGQCIGSWQTTCIDCTKQLSCRTCEANVGCVWCNTTVVENNSTFHCHSLTYANATTCPVRFDRCPCIEYQTCHECSKVQGCNYCDTGSCRPTGDPLCTAMTCECGNYFSCTSCYDDPNCGWCTGTSNCTALPLQCSKTETCDQHCFMELSCSECTKERGCGWCPSSDTCHSIDSSICGNALQSQCVKRCSAISDCNLCIDEGLPCEWCASTHSCIDIGFTSNCSSTDSCASEICPTLENCGECLMTPGCGWCEQGSGTCEDILNTKCSLARNCESHFEHVFSLGSFFGGMATMLALYLLIGICAFFYKKKNPPVHYQELQEPK